MGRIKNLQELLNAKDLNHSIIEIDTLICGYPFDELTEPQKNFFFIQELEREVNNGGFNQYFYNLSGDYAMYTVGALKAIGANHTWPILQEAIDQFPGGNVPEDRDRRQAVLEEIEDSANEIWDTLEQKFFQYQDNLNQLNIDYIKKNSSAF